MLKITQLLGALIEDSKLLPFFVKALEEYTDRKIDEEQLFRKVIGKFAEEGQRKFITNFESYTDLNTKQDVRIKMVEGSDFEVFGTFGPMPS
ncbi:hypothetical protein PRZ48_011879 [Zasmidium cellare]|uniref:Uncharacterized protein n=1 Tax=Zasmidium cellare TaxID=395010 RepID=A0ABR0E8L9_ZASCE|nr:hypothetical protein PRZ48_011879 [Zasmidium cellare]